MIPAFNYNVYITIKIHYLILTQVRYPLNLLSGFSEVASNYFGKY